MTRSALSPPSKSYNRAVKPPRYLRWIWAGPFLLLFQAGCWSTAAERGDKGQEFQQLCLDLSEAPGYFDTDNLVSNETSYQHALSRLPAGAARGKAYLGVGPGQNLTYIAHLRPDWAFIIDIRRDNALFHLYWKELFLQSGDRVEFLSRILGRPIAPGLLSPEVDAKRLVAAVQDAPVDRDWYMRRFERTWLNMLEHYPRLVQPEDRIVIKRLVWPFFEDGFDLRFRSHGRSPRPFYPSYGELILSTDLDGDRHHFLNSEADFQFLKQLQEHNRIVPVIGDFAGPKAIRAVGHFLKRHGLRVSTFYLSNVEFYLFHSRQFEDFASNMQTLPFAPESYLIRSHFGNFGRHPASLPGFFVTCLLQSAPRFLEITKTRPYQDYWDLVTRDYLPLQVSRD